MKIRLNSKLLLLFLFGFVHQIYPVLSLKRVTSGPFFTTPGDRIIDARFFELNNKQYVAVTGERGDTNRLLVYEFISSGPFFQLVANTVVTNVPSGTPTQNDAYGLSVYKLNAESGYRIVVSGGEEGNAYSREYLFDGSATITNPSNLGSLDGPWKGVDVVTDGTNRVTALLEQGPSARVFIFNFSIPPQVFLPIEAEGISDDGDVRWVVSETTGRIYLLVGSGDVTSSSTPVLYVYEHTPALSSAPSMTLRGFVTGLFEGLTMVRPFQFGGRIFATIGLLPSSQSPGTVVIELIETPTTFSLTSRRFTFDKVVGCTFVEHMGQAYLVEQVSDTGNPLRVYSFDLGSNTFTLESSTDAPVEFDTLRAITINGVGYVLAGGTASSPGLLLYQVVNAPAVNDDSYEVCTDATNVFLNVLANDIPGSDPSLSIVSVSTPTYGSAVILASLGILYDTPGGGFTGSDDFDYTVEDDNGNLGTATVSITVDGNAGPTAVDDAFEVCEGEAVNELHVIANDLAGCDPDLEIVSFTQGSEGTVTQVNSTVLNYAHTGATGTDSFTYTIEDGNGATDTATVTLNIS